MDHLILFDFDGTIADSSDGIFSTSLLTMRELGFDPDISYEDHKKFIGPPLRDSFRIAFGLDEKYLDDAVRIYRRIYRERGDKMLKAYPGIEDAIKRLKNAGYKVGVATNKAYPVAKRCLENIELISYFDVISAPLESEIADKAEIIKRASSSLSIPLESTVMIGDTDNDREGAERSGCHFIAALWGFGFDESDEGDLEFTLKSPSDITEEVIRRIYDREN